MLRFSLFIKSLKIKHLTINHKNFSKKVSKKGTKPTILALSLYQNDGDTLVPPSVSNF